jgi:Cytochrome c554 and c-prime
MTRIRLYPFCWALSLVLAACPTKPQDPKTQPDKVAAEPSTRPITLAPLPEPESSISIFFTADVQGHLEPCGCTKNPLGGVDRLSNYISEAKKRPTFAGSLLLDAGDLLFEKKTITFDRDAQLDKAGLITQFWTGLGLTAAMTGPRDLAAGPEALLSPNLASIPRLNASLPEKRRLLKEVAGLKIGIIGAASKDSGAPAAADPVAAFKEDVTALTKDGAQQIVVLSYGSYTFAQSLAAVGGVHFIIVASGDPEHIAKLDNEPGPSPTLANNVVLLTPFSQGQTVGEIELRVLGNDLSFEDGGKPKRLKESADNTARRMQEMLDKIDEAKKKKLDPTSLQKAVVKLSNDYQKQSQEAEASIQGSHFIARVVSLTGDIGSDPSAEKRKEDFMVAQGVKFKEAAKSEVLPEPGAGKAGYVGAEACADCHETENEFWKKTGHSHALQTLVTDNRDGHPECIECHVAGFRKPGGTTLISRLEDLGGVQCENCHGPGSLHVDNLGKEKTPSLVLYPNEATCRGCHYPPHTNNFIFEERIKNIVGPGHMYEKKKP